VRGAHTPGVADHEDPLARLAARGRAEPSARDAKEPGGAAQREADEKAERQRTRRAEAMERVAFASYPWAEELQWLAYLVGVLGMIGGATLLPNEDFPAAFASLGGVAMITAALVVVLFLLARPVLRARGLARARTFLREAGVPIDEDAFFESLGRYVSAGSRYSKAESFGCVVVELHLSPGAWIERALLSEALAGALPGSKIEHADERVVVVRSPSFEERIEALVWTSELVSRFVPALSARRPVERVVPRH
jgi:hypothetical protein